MTFKSKYINFHSRKCIWYIVCEMGSVLFRRRWFNVVLTCSEKTWAMFSCSIIQVLSHSDDDMATSVASATARMVNIPGIVRLQVKISSINITLLHRKCEHNRTWIKIGTQPYSRRHQQWVIYIYKQTQTQTHTRTPNHLRVYFCFTHLCYL